jgi:hypothetical protein
VQLVVSDGHVTQEMIVTDDSLWCTSHEAVEAKFLKDPDGAAEAIRLAMQLALQLHAGNPAVQTVVMH